MIDCWSGSRQNTREKPSQPKQLAACLGDEPFDRILSHCHCRVWSRRAERSRDAPPSSACAHVLIEKTDHLSDTIYKYQKGKHVMATPSQQLVLPIRSGI
jgi:hypothetical protein